MLCLVVGGGVVLFKNKDQSKPVNQTLHQPRRKGSKGKMLYITIQFSAETISPRSDNVTTYLPNVQTRYFKLFLNLESNHLI